MASSVLEKNTEGKARIQEDEYEVILSAADIAVHIRKTDGMLAGIVAGNVRYPLSNGPKLENTDPQFKSIKHHYDGNNAVVELEYARYMEARWMLMPSGILTLEYEYEMPMGFYDVLGISFSFPDTIVQDMEWIGDGPYRVWKKQATRSAVWAVDKKIQRHAYRMELGLSRI